MNKSLPVLALAIFIGPLPAVAVTLDPACQPVTDASLKKAAKPAWHMITHAPVGDVEVIKAGQQFFQYTDAGGWEPGPNLDESDIARRENILKGSFKILDCKANGTQTLRGVATLITQYRIDMPGFAATPVLLYTGLQDGLPYQQTYRGTITQFHYSGINAPRLP